MSSTCDRILPHKCDAQADVLVTFKDGAKRKLCYDCWLEVEECFGQLVHGVYVVGEEVVR